MSEKHKTEQVYDDEMAPLVARLIEIAKRDSIPLFVAAGMVMENGEAGFCTTLISAGGDKSLAGCHNRLRICLGIVRGHSGFDTASGLVITRHHAEVGDE